MAELFIATVKAFARAVFRAVVIAAIVRQKRFLAREARQFSTPSFPQTISIAHKVFLRMCGAGSQLKIAESVICLVLVFVMHQFGIEQRTPEVVAHHKAMLSDVSNVTMFQCVGVLWFENVNVSVSRNESSSLPSRISIATMCVARQISRIVTALDAKQRGPAWNELASTAAFAFYGSAHARIIHASQDGGNV